MKRRHLRPSQSAVALLLSGLALALPLAGCGQTPARDPAHDPASSGVPVVVFPTPPGPAAGTAIHFSAIADGVVYDRPATLCHTAFVAEGVISSYGPAHWNTATGSRPNYATPNTIMIEGYQIYTPMAFSRWQVLLDQRRAPTHEFVSMGGQVGNDTYHMGPFPHPAPGETFVFAFNVALIANQAPANEYSPTMMLLYVALPVDANNVVTFPVNNLQEPLSQLATQLKTC